MKIRILFILSILFLFGQPVSGRSNFIEIDEIWKIQFKDDLAFSSIDYDDSHWSEESFGFHTIIDQPQNHNRVLWARKKVNIPYSMKDVDLMFFLGNMSNSHEIYFNGNLLGKSMVSKTGFNDWNRKWSYYIPKSFIKYGKENIIAIKTFSTYEFGLGGEPFIGEYAFTFKQTQFYNFLSVNLYMGLSICLVFTCFYFSTIYFKTKALKKYLYFSLVCLCAAVYSTNYFIYDLPIPYIIYQKVIFTVLHMLLILFLPFFKGFLNIKFFKWDFYLCIAQIILSLTGALFTFDLLQYYTFRSYFLVFLSINLIYYIGICIYCIWVKNKNMIRLVGAIIITLLLVLHDISFALTGAFPYTNIYLTNYAILILLVSISVELIKEYNLLYIKANTDGLTGLYHQSYLKNVLNETFLESKVPSLCSFILCDIDYFKMFNDTYGHLAGDQVLKEIAQILSHSCPKTAIAVRYGGEEFALLLLNMNAMDAMEEAEKIRKKVEDKFFIIGNKDNIHVTVSIGVSTFMPKDDALTHPEVLIRQADEALYYSKETGKNRITHYKDYTVNH